MANLWDDIAKTIREGVDMVVEKTEELTKIGKIKVDIINIKRNIDKNFSELGGKVYHMLVEENATQIVGDKEVKEIIDCIKILEKELQGKKEELKKIKTKEKVKDKSEEKAEDKVKEKVEGKTEASAEPATKAKTKTKAKSATTAKSSSAKTKTNAK